MPPHYRRQLNQKAILWESTGRVDRHGEPIVEAPVEIDCRWITKRMEELDKDGNVISLDAQVVVKQEIPIGSVMILAELQEWHGTGSMGDDDELMVVVTEAETPTLKNRGIRRTLGLKRRHDTPPEVG